MSTKFEDQLVTLDGVSKTVIEWVDELGIRIDTVKSRRLRGMTWAESLSKKDHRDRRFKFGSRK